MTWEQCRKNTCHRHQRCMYVGNPWWCGEEKSPAGSHSPAGADGAPSNASGGDASLEGSDKNDRESNGFPPETILSTIIGGTVVYYVPQRRDPRDNPVGHNPPHSDWLWFDGPNGYNDWCNETTFPRKVREDEVGRTIGDRFTIFPIGSDGNPQMIVPQHLFDDLKELGREKGYMAAPPLPEHKDRKPAKRHHPVPKTPRRFRP